MKRISILGSTGSIGTQTLEVVRKNKDVKVCALAAGSNIEMLMEQIIEFEPELVCIFDNNKAKELAKRAVSYPVKVVSGMDGLVACAVRRSCDVVVAAVVGMIGIRPVIEAIKAGKDIALANKETLVTAGHIIIPLVKQHHVSLLPVDSEHSAIFQCLHQQKKEQVEKIILTASGGPFRGKTREELKNIRVEDALAHPNWSMGRKITIDSSTMVNKGLEVMEAKWLFGLDYDKIEVIIQPQSIIHSMVQFQDGAVLAQMGTPDMKLPIQYALTYPDRRIMAGERLDFAAIGSISFEKPDFKTFPGLKLAYEAGRRGGTMPAVYNAANEKAVSLFLEHRISYLEISEMIEWAMNEHDSIWMDQPTVEQIIETETRTYKILEEKWFGKENP